MKRFTSWLRGQRSSLSKVNHKTFSSLQDTGQVHEHIHVVADAQIVYVDHEYRHKTAFHNFQADFLKEHSGFDFQFVSISELAEIRNGSVIAESDRSRKNEELNVSNIALEILRVGAQCGASDVHILRRRSHTLIQLRIKQDLRDWKELPNRSGTPLLAAMYRLAPSRNNTYAEGEIQDASISGDILVGTGLTSVRIVRGPCYPPPSGEFDGGQFMSLRLQYEGKPQVGALPANVKLSQPRTDDEDVDAKLRSLGYDDDQIDAMTYVASMSSGATFSCGPTGSGKSTLQHYLSKKMHQMFPGKRQITTEQPVEHEKVWAVQMEISNTTTEEEAGQVAKEIQRATLRMDPDRLIVQEIRDAEGAINAIKSVETGHGLMSTLHIDDPFDFASRFRNLDFNRLSPAIVCNASIIRAVIYQRLLKILCDHCKIPFDIRTTKLPRRAKEAFETWVPNAAEVYSRSPSGCVHCHQTGISGVTGVAEVVVTDDELMADLVKFGASVARRRFRSRPDADRPVIRRAIDLALEGRVDPFELLELGQPIPFKDQYEKELLIGRKEREKALSGIDKALADET